MALPTRAYVDTLMSSSGGTKWSTLQDAIAQTLQGTPSTVLYLSQFARNATAGQIQTLLSSIELLASSVASLDQLVSPVDISKQLSSIKEELLRLELSSQRYQTSVGRSQVDTSINGAMVALSRYAPQQGLTDPATAKRQIPEALTSLLDAYSSSKIGVSAILTGVESFLYSPYWDRKSKELANSARGIIQSVSTGLAAGGSTNTLSSAAALSSVKVSLGTFVAPEDPRLPKYLGYPLLTVPSDVTVTSSVTPTSYIGNQEAIVTLNGSTLLSTTDFPQSTPPFSVYSVLVSDAVSFPVTVVPGEMLYIGVTASTTSGFTLVDMAYDHPTLGKGWVNDDGVYRRYIGIPLNSGPTNIQLTRDALVSLVNSGLVIPLDVGSYHVGGAAPYVSDNTWSIYANSALANIFVPAVAHQRAITIIAGFSNSVATTEKLGLRIGRSASPGSMRLEDVVNALQSYLPALGVYLARDTGVGRLVLKATQLPVSGSLTLSGSLFDAFAVSGTYVSSAEQASIPGNPIDLRTKLGTGDSIGTFGVAATVLPQVAVFGALSRKYDANPLVTLAVQRFYQEVVAAAKVASTVLAQLNVASAPALLAGAVSGARRKEFLALLEGWLNALHPVLAGLLTPTLYPGSSSVEAALYVQLRSALVGGGYNRALDMLSSLHLDEFLALTDDTASYAGSLKKAMVDVARTDLVDERNPGTSLKFL